MELDNFNFAVMIPARFKSSRFPGKPLIDLCGVPMIIRVWQQSVKAVGSDKVYVVTDDKRIGQVVKNYGGNVIYTSESCLTGTDRIAEANRELKFDFIINVQGDEPLINPRDIIKVVETYIEGDGEIVNAMARITDEEEFLSFTVPKVVVDESNSLLYMSRSGIPLSKTGKFQFGYKQVCIYAFSQKHLSFFYNSTTKSSLESVEDIEILRFLEAGYKVNMVLVDSGSIAIDVPSDVERVVERINSAKW